MVGPNVSANTLTSAVGAGDRQAGLRVLVVDDDEAIREMLTQLLSDEGYDTFDAENGVHALSVASSTHPDVIVLDMGLPVLDASGFVRAWKEREGALQVPVVAISGQPFGETMAREIGAVVFYEKPLDVTQFVASVRDLATRQAQRRPRSG